MKINTMKYRHIKAFDIPDCWYRTLETIWREGDLFYVGYGSEITETKKLNLTLEIQKPNNRPLIAEKAPCDMKYVTSYALQYLWLGIKEEGETYTYGGRLRTPVDQIELATTRLAEEPRDRQVLLLIRRPEDLRKELIGMKHEPPCLTILDLELLDNELHTTGYFRSWDAYAGLPANLAGLQIFLEAFVEEVNRKSGKSYSTGKMIFHCKNCHIYSRLNTFIEELIKPEEDSRRKKTRKNR
jgi:thymidylate synthase